LKSGQRNFRRLLSSVVKPGDRFLEIGCAPGEILAWVARHLRAQVAGIDCSATGIAEANRRLRALGVAADLRCEDAFHTTLPSNGFDVVYSAGLIEHFQRPADMVGVHISLARPGGTILITVPNYAGALGRVVQHFRSDVGEYHNFGIMAPTALKQCVDIDECDGVEASYFGRVTPENIPFENKWPWLLAKSARVVVNTVGLIQPFDVRALCPMLVLHIRRKTCRNVAGIPMS